MIFKNIIFVLVCGTRGREQKIVGGSETLPNELPWVAALFKQNKLYCGAAIISTRFLLTVCILNIYVIIVGKNQTLLLRLHIVYQILSLTKFG